MAPLSILIPKRRIPPVAGRPVLVETVTAESDSTRPIPGCSTAGACVTTTGGAPGAVTTAGGAAGGWTTTTGVGVRCAMHADVSATAMRESGRAKLRMEVSGEWRDTDAVSNRRSQARRTRRPPPRDVVLTRQARGLRAPARKARPDCRPDPGPGSVVL